MITDPRASSHAMKDTNFQEVTQENVWPITTGVENNLDAPSSRAPLYHTYEMDGRSARTVKTSSPPADSCVMLATQCQEVTAALVWLMVLGLVNKLHVPS
jgi:hypothetical protein